jgi:hypothetical protein
MNTNTSSSIVRVVNGYEIRLQHAGWVVMLGADDTCTFPGSQDGFRSAAELAERM